MLDDRTVTELNRAPLLADPTLAVTLERIFSPSAGYAVWRVRYRNDDGSYRGTTGRDQERIAGIFRQWTEGLAPGEPELFPPIPIGLVAST